MDHQADKKAGLKSNANQLKAAKQGEQRERQTSSSSEASQNRLWIVEDEPNSVDSKSNSPKANSKRKNESSATTKKRSSKRMQEPVIAETQDQLEQCEVEIDRSDSLAVDLIVPQPAPFQGYHKIQTCASFFLRFLSFFEFHHFNEY